MNRIASRSRERLQRTSRGRTVQPDIECLEDRKLLSTTIGQWSHPERITYSFVPDGTLPAYGSSYTSNLFSAMDAVAPAPVWQAQFEKAAAIWQAVSGINITLVPDSGDVLSSDGNQQDDPRFGDIRISGFTSAFLGSGHLAGTLSPPPGSGGTAAGDIYFNTSMPWTINSNYDILTTAIHEFGHALGMGHSAVSTAVMYGTYYGTNQSLKSDDIAGIQGLYGGVPADTTANSTAATAIDLTPMLDSAGRLAYGSGYVTSVGNMEWYKVTVPSTTNGTMVINMQSNNLSSLSPRMVIYDTPTHGLAQLLGTNVYGATLSYTLHGVSPGHTYYIRASSAQDGKGAGDNGAFGLAINFGSSPMLDIPTPNTVVFQTGDAGSGFDYESIAPNNGSEGQPSSQPGHNRHRTRGQQGHQNTSHVVAHQRGRTSVVQTVTVGHNHPRHHARFHPA